MMESIKERIDRFLETEKLDYALMIAGDWGIGKTFFIK